MVRELLEKRFNGVTFVSVVGENGGITRYLSPSQIEMLKRETDVVIATTAD
jgi:hypothetical protein